MTLKPIATENKWISFCREEGWPRSAEMELRMLWRKYHRPARWFRISCGTRSLPHLFVSESDASKWAIWNYKGRTDCWSIVPPGQ